MANVYLNAKELWKEVNNNTFIFATSIGDETVLVGSDVTGLIIDANTETVGFQEKWSNYTYKNEGTNLLKVYSITPGNTPIATISVQEDGSILKFANGDIEIKIVLKDGKLVMTFGGTVINNSTPTTLEPLPIVTDHNINTEGNIKNNIEGLDNFHFTGGTYNYTINGFNKGDTLDFPTGANSPTLTNSNADDGKIDFTWANGGQILTITVTGIPTADDGTIFGLSSWQSVFGATSIA